MRAHSPEVLDATCNCGVFPPSKPLAVLSPINVLPAELIVNLVDPPVPNVSLLLL